MNITRVNHYKKSKLLIKTLIKLTDKIKTISFSSYILMPGFKRSKKNPKLNLNPKCQLVRSSVTQFVEEHDFGCGIQDM